MNLFKNSSISALFYLLVLFSTVACRISDKRKCADAGCSKPVSLVTTLIRYNADDDRLMSFPRNAKLKVFSKEAGDTPNFWEVEVEGSNKCVNFHGSREHFIFLCQEVINGKRGYVPKGLLREDRVLIPPSQLTYIVPTGRIDSPKQNITKVNLAEPESNSINLLSATPELPAANSKGFFSTIGGVSADSVPMNSPDIKPQSTRKFQVFDGTTLYEDVVSERPESPPTVIDNNGANGNRENNEKLLDSKEVPKSNDVPSSDVKPVNENVDENFNESEQMIGTDQEVREKDEVKEEEEDSGKLSGDTGNQPEVDASESNLFNNIMSSVSSFISSGAGEDITEEDEDEEEEDEEDEEDEEGDVKGYEEGKDNEEGESKTEEFLEGTNEKESEVRQQPEEQHLEGSQKNTSEAPSFDNILDQKSSEVVPDSAKSEEHDNLVKKEMESINKITGANNNEQVTEKYIVETSSDLKTHMEVESKVDEKETLLGTSEEKEEFLNIIEVDKIKSTPSHSSDSLKEDLLQSKPDIEDYDHGTNFSSNHEETPDQGTSQDLKETKSQGKIQGDSIEMENILEQTNDQSDNVQQEIKIDELQNQEKSMTDELQVEGDFKVNEFQAEKQPVSNESEIQEQLQSDKPLIPEDSELDVLQVQDQIEAVNLQVEEEPDFTTLLPPGQPTTRQFLFGSAQKKQEIVEENVSETPPNNDMKLDTEASNGTQENIPTSTYSSLPKMEQIVSPKYSSVISRRIQSAGSSSVSEISANSEEEEISEPELDETPGTSGSSSTSEETVSPDLLQPSQSPKYSSVVSNRIGILTPTYDVESDRTTETQAAFTDSADINTTEEKSPDVTVEEKSEAAKELIEESESKEVIAEESVDIPLQDSQPSTPSDEVISADEVKETPDSPADVIEETPVSAVDVVDETPISSENVGDEIPAEQEPEEGVFAWVSSLLDVFGSKDSERSTEESPATVEKIDSSPMTHFAEETCSAGGVDGSCPTTGDAMQKDVTWQETTQAADMWELVDRIPLEATMWLIITAVVVLIFSLGHYYIEAHRRDGPLVAIINKLEREVLILKKERCIMEDRLNIAEQQLEAWNTSSSENDALVVELKQELEETKAAKAELEELAAQLKEELETVTESGLEMHRLLEESLSSQDGSQVLLSTVETLREKLQQQEQEISGLSDTLSSKNAEVEELHSRLAQSAEVARSLEDKVISVSREKEEELLQLQNKHRELISQLEENTGRTEVMETKALEETRLSTEMSKLRLTIEELQKTLAERDSELDTLKEVVKELRATDSNEKIEALFDVVGVQAKLKTAVAERDDFREKFLEEEGARKLLEGHMKKITQEVAELKDSFETAEKEKIEALTKLQVLSNYFKEKESQLQKELGLQESMWLQKQSDDHTIYEQMRSLREENEKYKIAKGEVQTSGGTPKPLPNLAEVKTKKKSNPKLGSGQHKQTQGLQNESLKKEIVEQEASFKIQLANTEQKAHENWVASRQAERRLKEAQQEAAQLRNRLTAVEKNTAANYSLDEKPNISESNGDPSSPPPSLMYPPTTSPPFMMYPPIPPPGDFVPPPPLMGSPYPSDSRPPPLGRISSPPLDHRFSPPPPLPPYAPYDYPPYGHHSPSPPPPMPPHHRTVHKPQPREMSREQKDHVPNYSPEAEKTSRKNKR